MIFTLPNPRSAILHLHKKGVSKTVYIHNTSYKQASTFEWNPHIQNQEVDQQETMMLWEMASNF
jgi:hypothetical protein